MSLTFDARHEIDIAPDAYYREIHLAGPFNVWLHEEKLGVGYREIASDHATGMRKIEMVPRPEVPATLKRFIGESFKMVEEGRLEGDTYRFVVHPEKFGDRIQVKGEMRLEPREGGCVRCVRVTIDARVPGLGGLVERVTEKNVKKSLDESARFANEWIREKLQ
jgi:hypothetical protein